ncbi:MAG: hypothetical protein LC102_06980 [Ignavibacteriales bacterium]|nr:MAG: hypothetical protein F9K26_10875 [Ignavibacteriaceae bacterium]MBW7874053.1 hypothetical protein [Ignavibacteria bacterium]MCZ2143153.1 hypothetical protein [Ignavibacteriales bacterium]OQY74023.1 MAG: hypothetical protein B6D45_07455 [Ignavibacteriales bacterium UTCHB3]MBV6444032.1 hypothetical protein [Ignavibacteriaceae bacterium]
MTRHSPLSDIYIEAAPGSGRLSELAISAIFDIYIEAAPRNKPKVQKLWQNPEELHRLPYIISGLGVSWCAAALIHVAKFTVAEISTGLVITLICAARLRYAGTCMAERVVAGAGLAVALSCTARLGFSRFGVTRPVLNYFRGSF